MYWFPCKQILTDKADSIRAIFTTNSDCLVGSNGLLKTVTNLPDNKVRYEWVSHYPIAYYLISFAVGPYTDYSTYTHTDNPNDSLLIQSYLISNSPYLSAQLVAVEKPKQIFSSSQIYLANFHLKTRNTAIAWIITHTGEWKIKQ